MPRPQLQTVALRTRLSIFLCAESPAPDSLVFVQNNGWEWALSGRKLGGNDRSTDNLSARQWPARVFSVFASAAFALRLRAIGATKLRNWQKPESGRFRQPVALGRSLRPPKKMTNRSQAAEATNVVLDTAGGGHGWCRA